MGLAHLSMSRLQIGQIDRWAWPICQCPICRLGRLTDGTGPSVNVPFTNGTGPFANGLPRLQTGQTGLSHLQIGQIGRLGGTYTHATVRAIHTHAPCMPPTLLFFSSCRKLDMAKMVSLLPLSFSLRSPCLQQGSSWMKVLQTQ